MKKAVLFGAGNIGRGFLGQLFSQAGYEIIFVDANKEIVNLLNEKGAYPLKIVGEHPQEIIIKNIQAVNAQNEEKVREEISECEIIATAVGADALKSVSLLIVQGLIKRIERNKKPLNIIICENLVNAAKVLKSYIMENIPQNYLSYLDTHLGLVESVVSRMVPVLSPAARKKNPLLIIAEEYDILPVDKGRFKGEIPQIKGMIPYDNLNAYEEQKLFIHNAGHAVIAYLGYLKGYKYIYEAIEDKEIYAIVSAALQESGEALNKKYKFSIEEQESYVKDLLRRFSNRDLRDSIARVGKDPLRKLSFEERLIGAAKLALKYGIEPYNLVKGIVSAFKYDNRADKQAVELSYNLQAKGVDWVLEKKCGLDLDERLSQMIKEEWNASSGIGRSRKIGNKRST